MFDSEQKICAEQKRKTSECLFRDWHGFLLSVSSCLQRLWMLLFTSASEMLIVLLRPAEADDGSRRSFADMAGGQGEVVSAVLCYLVLPWCEAACFTSGCTCCLLWTSCLATGVRLHDEVDRTDSVRGENLRGRRKGASAGRLRHMFGLLLCSDACSLLGDA